MAYWPFLALELFFKILLKKSLALILWKPDVCYYGYINFLLCAIFSFECKSTGDYRDNQIVINTRLKV